MCSLRGRARSSVQTHLHLHGRRPPSGLSARQESPAPAAAVPHPLQPLLLPAAARAPPPATQTPTAAGCMAGALFHSVIWQAEPLVSSCSCPCFLLPLERYTRRAQQPAARQTSRRVISQHCLPGGAAFQISPAAALLPAAAGAPPPATAAPTAAGGAHSSRRHGTCGASMMTEASDKIGASTISAICVTGVYTVSLQGILNGAYRRWKALHNPPPRLLSFEFQIKPSVFAS